MANTKLVVDQSVLTEIVNTLETNGGLANRSALFKAAEKAYNAAKPDAQVSSAVIALRIGEYKIALKTPLGKRGRHKKEAVAVSVISEGTENTEAAREVSELVQEEMTEQNTETTSKTEAVLA